MKRGPDPTTTSDDADLIEDLRVTPPSDRVDALLERLEEEK